MTTKRCKLSVDGKEKGELILSTIYGVLSNSLGKVSTDRVLQQGRDSEFDRKKLLKL